MVPEERLLLNAILDEPKKDHPRLIFADWCMDHGKPLRAEFIQVQCQLEQWKQGDASRSLSRIGIQTHTSLKAREKELFGNWEATEDFSSIRQDALGGPRDPSWPKSTTHAKKVDQCAYTVFDHHSLSNICLDEKPVLHIVWKRGFVYKMSLTEEMWLYHADDLIQYNPLEEVDILTAPLVINARNNQVYWYLRRYKDAPGLHRYLFERLGKKGIGRKWTGGVHSRVYYDRAEDAYKDMTYACFQYAKDKQDGNISYPEILQPSPSIMP